MIAIIDYGVGNLGSVLNAFKYLGYEAIITSNKEDILKADKVVLPGVGAFSDAMNAFKARDFESVIHEVVDKGTPVLGICVGMQMLFEKSFEYGIHDGLGFLKGNIIKFDDNGFKVPQIGWNQIKVIKDNPLLKGLDNKYVYFVHSYHLDESEYAIAVTEYANRVYPSAINYKNIYATQFHPEKSGEVGLQILKNFGEL